MAEGPTVELFAVILLAPSRGFFHIPTAQVLVLDHEHQQFRSQAANA
jgi:hypothetical protein